MSKTLVIVESPAKAKTIGKYLGPGYVVRASMGHVRDLPQKALGVDVESGSFEPQYELVKGRYKTIAEIKTLAKDASQVLLATDPDREGEAIAWHVVYAAGLSRSRDKVSRVEFHEITERAIKAAIAKPRQLDMSLVNAQQARRVLDRLVGYKISPLLWKKVQKGTSAGRVQSVALRVVVEREREIEQFVPREFWTVEADLAKAPFSQRKSDIFRAYLWDKKEKRKAEFEKGDTAQNIVKDLEGATWKIANITKKETQRRSSAPFITSTLQQEAARKLRLKTQDTMRIAQQLYEGISLGTEGTSGLITYMRTDSTSVAYEAQMAARDVIKEHFGAEYLPDKPPFYAKKVKGAQEAHEAIRPTKPARTPEAVKPWLTPDQYRLYRLIWQRFIASQMAPARIEVTTVDIEAQPIKPATEPYPFRASGERVIFPGFLAVYREGRGDSEEDEPDEGSLPALGIGNLLELLKLAAEQHFTEPPPRYGEASLVKALEELGVGRPSTYATILGTLRDRGYVVEIKTGKERKFFPTELGRAVTDLLVARFPELLDVQFTAKLESELDEIAEGKRQWTPVVAALYTPMMAQVKKAELEVAKIEVPAETLPMGQDEDKESKTGYSRRSYSAKSGTSGKSYSSGRARKSYSGYSKTDATKWSAPAETSPASAKPRPRRTSSNTAPEAPLTKITSKPRTRRTTAKTAAENLVTEVAPKPRTRRTSITAAQSQTETQLEPAKPTRRRSTKPTEVATPATTPAAPATTAPACPLCEKPMVKRKGPYSEFWGCSGYPNCKGIRKLT